MLELLLTIYQLPYAAHSKKAILSLLNCGHVNYFLIDNLINGSSQPPFIHSIKARLSYENIQNNPTLPRALPYPFGNCTRDKSDYSVRHLYGTVQSTRWRYHILVAYRNLHHLSFSANSALYPLTTTTGTT